MKDSSRTLLSRRMLLRYLAGSPLLAALTWTDIWPVDLGSQEGPELFPSALSDLESTIDGLIASADKAINVFDFASVAKKKLPPAHYGYLATGVEDERVRRTDAVHDFLGQA